ncbi:putative phage-like protein YoqJ [Bacillus pakistanensis]|uniref:UPF0398 protein JOC86_000833 n=1 Tax=Rossellomorea pakistanensis TaxID=992288 RepID=A0ABS2N8W6_9BACI|nr:DUF1273 domain-containing protein [Bacillus pakistanensis]MBM7584296.1 putative phage-like protein YoqJ [Bacillus pakistanensis]
MTSVVTVSGYKQHELGLFKQDDPAIGYIKKALEKELASFADEGLEWVVISGQLGVELWAAEVVIDMQLDYPNIKLAVLTPFLNQEENWNENNKELYEMILTQAEFVDSISKEPYNNPQQFRNKNQLLLHKSDALLILYDEEREGSPKYLYEGAKIYQESHPLEIRQITFMDLQFIADEEQQRLLEEYYLNDH